MRRNLSVHWETKGTYATDLFTNEAVETIKNHDQNSPLFMLISHLAPHTGNEFDPMQAPEDEIKKFSYIKDEKRRTYAAMVSRLDKGIGKVVKALGEQKMLDNSIILFLSDNGSPVVGNTFKYSNFSYLNGFIIIVDNYSRSTLEQWIKLPIQRCKCLLLSFFSLNFLCIWSF